MYPADELSRVSHGGTDSMHHTSSPRTMPAAARSAFKALERESMAAIARSRVAPSATAAAASASPPAQSAIDTLCLVTYSDDEDAASSWQQQQQHVQRLFASSALSTATAKAAQPGKAGAIFAALCSEDHTEEGDDGLPEVMETLCMLSYDEDSV